MNTLALAALLILPQAMVTLGGVPEPVTDLAGSDDIEMLVEGYPEETHDLTATIGGLKPTPEFRQGFRMAMRLRFLGAEPHYLVYEELTPLPDPSLPLKTFKLRNYKHTAKLLESIRGFDFSMQLHAWDLRAAKWAEGEQASSGQPTTRSESKSENDDKAQPESEGCSR